MGAHGFVIPFKRDDEFLVKKKFYDFNKLYNFMPTVEDLLKKSYATLTKLKGLGTSARKIKTIEIGEKDNGLILSDLSEGKRYEVIDFMDLYDTKTRELQKQFRNYKNILETIIQDVGIMHKNEFFPCGADMWLILKRWDLGETVLVDPLEIYGREDARVKGRENQIKMGVLSFLLDHFMDDKDLTIKLLDTYHTQNPDHELLTLTLDAFQEYETHVEMFGLMNELEKIKQVLSIKNEWIAKIS